MIVCKNTQIHECTKRHRILNFKMVNFGQAVMVYIFNPSIWEVEGGGSQVWSQTGLQSESQDRQGHIEKPHLETPSKKRVNFVVCQFYKHTYNLFIFMCMDVLRACMSVYHVHAWFPWRPEEGVRHPRHKLQTVVSSHNRYCEWSLGPLKSRHSVFNL